jgi:DNA damage-inducible protein 1
MADAVLAEDTTLLTALLEERAVAKAEKEEQEKRRIEELNADPFNAENQVRTKCNGCLVFRLIYEAIIEKKILEENLSQNYQDAMEYIPEAFGSVVMLYIPVVVNGISCQAFVGTHWDFT